ncbi:MAG: hypothetical protein ACK4TG_07070, partial [Thermaurantiacus sp.]
MTAPGLPARIRLGAREVPLRVRRNPRARRMLLRVCGLSQELRLTLPRRASASEALGFLAAQHGWMLRSMERSIVPARPFVPGVCVPVAGDTLTIVSSTGRAVARDGALLRVPGADGR